MKKLLILPAVIMIAAAVNAQTEASLKSSIQTEKKVKKEDRKELRKLEGNDVSYRTKQVFTGDFGDINGATWKRTPTFDEATFTKDGMRETAYYDYDAKLVGTTTRKTFSDLPVNAQKYIDRKYTGYTKGRVIFFDDNEFNETDMVLYGSQFDDADNYFIELTKGTEKIILDVNTAGDVSFFKKM
jgi:hypothetical protein